MVTIEDYKSNDPIAWCPGCGNFGILAALKKALVALDLRPQDICMASGIGQAAKLPHYLKGNIFNGLHGRTLSVATGIHLANPALKVIAIGGDGDGYAEGGNHFLHALRRNPDITYIVHDNQVFGLTRGQISPTSDQGYVSPTTPWGQIAGTFNPIAVAIALDASFVARGFAGNIEHLSQIIQEGMRTDGFALIDILQPCVTFNKVNTSKWYNERVYKLEEGYDPYDRTAAFSKAFELAPRIPIGVIYRGSRASYYSLLASSRPKMKPVGYTHDPSSYHSLLKDFSE